MELGGVDIAILGKRHGLQYQRCGHAEEHRLPENVTVYIISPPFFVIF